MSVHYRQVVGFIHLRYPCWSSLLHVRSLPPTLSLCICQVTVSNLCFWHIWFSTWGASYFAPYILVPRVISLPFWFTGFRLGLQSSFQVVGNTTHSPRVHHVFAFHFPYWFSGFWFPRKLHLLPFSGSQVLRLHGWSTCISVVFWHVSLYLDICSQC